MVYARFSPATWRTANCFATQEGGRIFKENSSKSTSSCQSYRIFRGNVNVLGPLASTHNDEVRAVFPDHLAISANNIQRSTQGASHQKELHFQVTWHSWHSCMLRWASIILDLYIYTYKSHSTNRKQALGIGRMKPEVLQTRRCPPTGAF